MTTDLTREQIAELREAELQGHLEKERKRCRLLESSRDEARAKAAELADEREMYCGMADMLDGQRREARAERDRAVAALRDGQYALRDLVEIIDKAGLQNLSNGVQLGATSWYVKASGVLEYARQQLAREESSSGE